MAVISFLTTKEFPEKSYKKLLCTKNFSATNQKLLPLDEGKHSCQIAWRLPFFRG